MYLFCNSFSDRVEFREQRRDTHTHGKNVETTLLRRRNVNTLHKCPSTVVLLVTSENEFITLVSYVRVTDRLRKQHRPV